MKRTLTISALVALALAVFAMSTLPAEAGRARSGRLFGAFPEMKGGLRAYIRTHSQSQPNSDAGSDTNSGANADAGSDTNSESEPKPESEPNPESVAKPEPEPEPKPKSDADSGTNANSGARPKSGTNPNSGTTSATNSVTLEEPAPLAGSFLSAIIFLKPHPASRLSRRASLVEESRPARRAFRYSVR